MEESGSSYMNRKKVAFSQLVNGVEVELRAELDMWDHVNKKAIFWVEPLELSSEYTNVFYFYYNKEKTSNAAYILEASDITDGSSFIWDTKFTSVHHFNPYFGYINSTNTNDPVISLNNVTSSLGSLGGYALTFSSSTSYADLGNYTKYNYGTTAHTLIFGAINSGNILFSKGLYSDCTTTLYYQETPTLINDSFDDDFVGPVGTIPDICLWTVRVGNPLQNAGSLEFSQALDERLRSNFYVGGSGTLVTVNFNIVGGELTSGWLLGLRVRLLGFTYDYLIQFTPSGSNIVISFLRVSSDTYTVLESVGITTLIAAGFSGTFKASISGTSLCLSCYYDGSWRTFTCITVPSTLAYGYIEIDKKQSTSSNLTKFYISNYRSNYENSFFRRSSKNSNVLSLESRINNQKRFLEIPEFILNSTWSSYSFGVASEIPTTKAVVSESNSEYFSGIFEGAQTNTLSVILGDSVSGFIGKISEIFFFKTQQNEHTIFLMTKSLEDSLISISRYFLRGYTTIENRSFSTTVLAYDKDTGDLLATTVSKAIDGYYYMEVPIKNNYFIVGLGSTMYNNKILSNITPQIIF
jgi:hypothetical protein